MAHTNECLMAYMTRVSKCTEADPKVVHMYESQGAKARRRRMTKHLCGMQRRMTECLRGARRQVS